MSIKQRLLKSSSYLVLSNFLVGIFGILSISIIAKTITISEFGFFAIIQAYAMTINGLLNFQTWQTIVKHYPEAKNDEKLLKSLLKYSFKLDLVTAILAFIVAISILPFIYKIIQLDELHLNLTNIYLLYILFSIEGTVTGYFRSIDRYNIFIYVEGFTSILKFLTIYYVSLFFPSLENFIITFVVIALLKSLLLNLFFIKSIGLKFYKEIFYSSTNYVKNRFKDIREFSIFSSLTGSFDVVFKQADVLVVSTFFGSHFAGIFKMIKTIGGLVLQLVNPIFLSIYPIVSEKKKNILELKQFINKSIVYLSMIALAGLIVFYISHKYIVELFFSKEYLQYSNYLLLYIVPIIISGVFTAVHPAFNLLGYHKLTLYLLISTSIFYIFMIYILKDYFGFESMLYMLIIHSIIIVGYKYYKILKHKVDK